MFTGVFSLRHDPSYLMNHTDIATTQFQLSCHPRCPKQMDYNLRQIATVTVPTPTPILMHCRKAPRFSKQVLPVISMDSKKKELRRTSAPGSFQSLLQLDR